VSDPRGHLFGQPAEAIRTIPADWRSCRDYLHGIDLFNYGYYWEAHEAWECVWHAAGRAGPLADFIKGLIKLAAAGVKTLEGSPVGRERHATRAAALFRQARSARRQPEEAAEVTMWGLSLEYLEEEAARIARTTPSACERDQPSVLGLILHPDTSTADSR
jgi:hypothetical protein